MSYTLTFTGDREAVSADEAQSFEQAIAEAARAFVGELEGLTSATGAFSVLGKVDLTQAAPAERPQGNTLAGEVAANARAFALELDGMAEATVEDVRARIDAFSVELEEAADVPSSDSSPARAPSEPAA